VSEVTRHRFLIGINKERTRIVLSRDPSLLHSIHFCNFHWLEELNACSDILSYLGRERFCEESSRKRKKEKIASREVHRAVPKELASSSEISKVVRILLI
jgi:hypothetical protein